MARLDEAKVEEIKQFLQRLEKLAPSPKTDEPAPPEMPPQQLGAKSAPEIKFLASAIEQHYRRVLLFARTELGTNIVVAMVSALLSTCITVLIIRGMLAPQNATTEYVFRSQAEQAQAADLPPSEAGMVALPPEPAPVPAPSEPAKPDVAANVDAASSASVATVEPHASDPVPESPKPEPPVTPPPVPEAAPAPPPSIAETAEKEHADQAQAPEPISTASTSDSVPPSAPAVPDAAQDLQRGRLMLSGGNIGAARELLESAAGLGNGEAALLLASTYDPLRSQEAGVAGIVPDAGLARRWYERAAELGVEEAHERLLVLDMNPVPEWRRIWLPTSPPPRQACTDCVPARTSCTPRPGVRCSRARAPARAR